QRHRPAGKTPPGRERNYLFKYSMTATTRGTKGAASSASKAASRRFRDVMACSFLRVCAAQRDRIAFADAQSMSAQSLRIHCK
ncbi:MAG TPA: hypothetical protein VK620_35355, partial [Bradyrhizobium sp.]|nr:hypothetical protein [Bradyrhizobium sp.]